MHRRAAFALALCLAAGACRRRPDDAGGGGGGGTAAPPGGAAAGAAIGAAQRRAEARDGRGCLAELDRHDRDPARATRPSAEPASPLATFRAQCLLLAGRCDEGKALVRQALAAGPRAPLAPALIEGEVDGLVGLYCEGDALGPRDRVLRVTQELTLGAYQAKQSAAWCRERIDTLRRLAREVPPRDDGDERVKNAAGVLLSTGPVCLGRAGDCAGAYELYREQVLAQAPGVRVLPPDKLEPQLRQGFHALVADCPAD